MAGWIVWLIAGSAFGVGEMLTKRLLLAPLALGAAAAAIIDVVIGGLASWVAFLLVSLSALLLARGASRSRTRTPLQMRSGAETLIGQQAIVLEQIVNDQGSGYVKIGGEVWTARAFDEDDVIDRGTRVEVVDIKGATALVTE